MRHEQDKRMTKLDLSIAIGDYDRIRPLVSGAVQIDGVDPVFMHLEPEEIFFRSFRQQAFDICELSLSTCAVAAATGGGAYVGVPVFPSRAFRHNSIYIRTDRGIAGPQDLKGRRIGIPEYQLTATVWARAILLDDHGVRPADIAWVRGGLEQPGRVEKIQLALPDDVHIEQAPEGATLSGMLARGEIDGLIAPRAPSCFEHGEPDVGWLFPDPAAAATDWFRRVGIFPIMHILGIRRSLVERHPWLPVACLKAFEQARSIAVAKLADPSAAKVTLPFLEETVLAARRLMGRDYWSYGLERNWKVLDTFLDHHYRQGLSARRVQPEELFHPSVVESFKI
jgi:4,5-dihydroxyphthalate decarboxylase